MRYKITHLTRYTYEGPVSHCISETRLMPRELVSQSVEKFEMEVRPKPAGVDRRTDYFGNPVSAFTVLEPHDRLTVITRSIVDLNPQPIPLGRAATWEETRKLLATPPNADLMAASEYRWESPFVPWLDALIEFGRPVFTPGRPVREAALALMQRIHRDFKYAPKSTSIETPLGEVMEARRGVCQDFAHVMIGTLRAWGLAARYVSGYLRSDKELQGAQASHAWVSVFSPGAGWVDFDPTNNILPSGGHITLAWGRDFGDVTPVRGVTMGGGQHKVDVEVRVLPV